MAVPPPGNGLAPRTPPRPAAPGERTEGCQNGHGSAAHILDKTFRGTLSWADVGHGDGGTSLLERGRPEGKLTIFGSLSSCSRGHTWRKQTQESSGKPPLFPTPARLVDQYLLLTCPPTSIIPSSHIHIYNSPTSCVARDGLQDLMHTMQRDYSLPFSNASRQGLYH